MESRMSRRDLLARLAGAACAAVYVVTCGPEALAEGTAAAAPAGAYDPTLHRWTMLVDVTKCIGCGSCVRACAAENHVPEHFFRTWIERYTINRDGEVLVDSEDGGKKGFPPLAGSEDATKSFFVPKLCNHCSMTPCIQLCPVGASYKTPDGVVLVDEKRCIGCGYCVQACPYGSRFIHPETHCASKCTFCYHRTTEGLRPACVEVCPTRARVFGDLMDPNDEVARRIATEQVFVLKPELLTEPVVHYYGIGMEVR